MPLREWGKQQDTIASRQQSNQGCRQDENKARGGDRIGAIKHTKRQRTMGGWMGLARNPMPNTIEKKCLERQIEEKRGNAKKETTNGKNKSIKR